MSKFEDFQKDPFGTVSVIVNKIENIKRKIAQLSPKLKEPYETILDKTIKHDNPLLPQFKPLAKALIEQVQNTNNTQLNKEQQHQLDAKIRLIMSIDEKLDQIETSLKKQSTLIQNPVPTPVQKPQSLPSVPAKPVVIQTASNVPPATPKSIMPDKELKNAEMLSDAFDSLDSSATSPDTSPRSTKSNMTLADAERLLINEFDSQPTTPRSAMTDEELEEALFGDKNSNTPSNFPNVPTKPVSLSATNLGKPGLPSFPAAPTKPVTLSTVSNPGTPGLSSQNKAPPMTNLSSSVQFRKEMERLKAGEQLLKNKSPAVDALYTKEMKKNDTLLARLEKGSDSITSAVNQFAAPTVDSDAVDKLINQELANSMPKPKQ